MVTFEIFLAAFVISSVDSFLMDVGATVVGTTGAVTILVDCIDGTGELRALVGGGEWDMAAPRGKAVGSPAIRRCQCGLLSRVFFSAMRKVIKSLCCDPKH